MLLTDDHVSVLGDFVFWDKGVGPNFQIKYVTLPHKNPEFLSDTFKELMEKPDMSIGHIVCYVYCVTLKMFLFLPGNTIGSLIEARTVEKS